MSTNRTTDVTTTEPAAGSTPGIDSTQGALGVRMLHDRVLVSQSDALSERRSRSGIVIPATASVGKRLAWGTVVAVGQHVRQVGVGQRVLFEPEDRGEVEIDAVVYLLLRERDIHAVAEPRNNEDRTGLYL